MNKGGANADHCFGIELGIEGAKLMQYSVGLNFNSRFELKFSRDVAVD
jgi:hypothetical protein